MKAVYNCERFIILEDTPTYLKPFYSNMEQMTNGKRIRFVIDRLFGYKAHYLSLKNVVGDYKDNIIAYCTVSSGEKPRYFLQRRKTLLLDLILQS